MIHSSSDNYIIKFIYIVIISFYDPSHHKWITIHGNGTFISPGIIIIDWVILNKPSGKNVTSFHFHELVISLF